MKLKDNIVEEYKAGSCKFRMMHSREIPDHMSDHFYVLIRLPEKTVWKKLLMGFETEAGARGYILRCLCSLVTSKALQWPYARKKVIHRVNFE